MAKQFERTTRIYGKWFSEEALAMFAFVVATMATMGFSLDISRWAEVLESIQANLDQYEGEGLYNDRDKLREIMGRYTQHNSSVLPDALLYLDWFEKSKAHGCASGQCKCQAVV